MKHEKENKVGCYDLLDFLKYNALIRKKLKYSALIEKNGS